MHTLKTTTAFYMESRVRQEQERERREQAFRVPGRSCTGLSTNSWNLAEGRKRDERPNV